MESHEKRKLGEFVIKGKMPGLNRVISSNRRNPYAGARLKGEWDAICYFSILKAKKTLTPVNGPCRIEFEWHEANRRRDPDNIFSAKKFILDAMQEAKIIPNDSQKYIAGLSDRLIVDQEYYVKVTIWEADNAGHEE